MLHSLQSPLNELYTDLMAVVDGASFIPAPITRALSHRKPSSPGHPVSAAVLRTAREETQSVLLVRLLDYLGSRFSRPSKFQH